MNDDLKKKLKFNIAISQIKKEEQLVMKSSKKFVMKNIGIAAGIVIALSGMAFASGKVIESVWKTPTKVEYYYSQEITEDVRKENISLEEAKKVAIEKLSEIGFNTNIVKNDEYVIANSEIHYRFYTEDEYHITINAKTGKFYDIWDDSRKNNNKVISGEEAIKKANEFYKLFGFKENEYELNSVWVNSKEGNGKGSGVNVSIRYVKKYGETINPYEAISISIYADTKRQLGHLRVSNTPFDNNEVLISKEDAIKIALQEDKKIETNAVAKTESKLMVVKMNADAYNRINNKESFYKAIRNPDEERNYYSVEARVRNAWVVAITYEDNYGEDVSKRYTKGFYSYFVDATTGEIIGGSVSQDIDSINRFI